MAARADIAVVAFAQLKAQRNASLEEVELVAPVVNAVLAEAGLTRPEIGLWCSGSNDYLIGRPFSFVAAVDALGAWPPIDESHVEMDGAWALHEAWVRLLHGELDTALVYAFGASSAGDVPRVMAQGLDPYLVAPLGLDAVDLAALQARAMLDAGLCTERDMAEVAVRNRRRAANNPYAQLTTSADADVLLNAPYHREPLRVHDCPPISDGACALVLARGDRARELCERPAWITGLDHRIDVGELGLRDLTVARSATLAAQAAGVGAGPVDVAEVHAPFTHQELLLRRALGLGPEVDVNPSGGAQAAHPLMVAGLTRIGEAARRILDGTASRVVAHATSGMCLQQNLVAVMAREPGPGRADARGAGRQTEAGS